MIKIHTAPTAVEIHNLKNALEHQGIACDIRGEFRRAAVGELPPNECWVELWIVEDSDEEASRRIMSQATSTAPPSWKCPGCDEVIEGQFGKCWKCQHDRSHGVDS